MRAHHARLRGNRLLTCDMDAASAPEGWTNFDGIGMLDFGYP
jgi:hypothetical protein